MGKKLRVALSGVALLGLVAGSITFASASSSETSPVGPWGRPKGWTYQGGPVSLATHEGGETFVVREKLTNEKFINVDGRGFQPGDYIVFKTSLFSKAGRRVGHTNSQCTANFPLRLAQGTATFLCRGAFVFTARRFHGRGQIMVEGALAFTPQTKVVTLPITGGTRHFQNVRGEIHVSQTRPLITFHLIP